MHFQSPKSEKTTIPNAYYGTKIPTYLSSVLDLSAGNNRLSHGGLVLEIHVNEMGGIELLVG